MKKFSYSYDNIIFNEKNGNIYFIGKEYKLTFPFEHTPCHYQYNESLRRLEHFTCIKLNLNGLNIKELIRSILDDFSHVANIGVVSQLPQDIVKYLKKFYDLSTLKNSEYPRKKSKSPKRVFALTKIQSKRYKNQLVDLIFNEKPIDFLTLSAEEQFEKYRFEVYFLMKCSGNNNFHDLYNNYYFDDGYLDLLENHLRNKIEFNRELKSDFINLRFEGNRLVVKLKRSIKREINCDGFAIDVFDDFMDFGITELFDIMDYYGISRNVFENNIIAENITQFHLGEKINCDIKTEQPELSNRLTMNQMNDMEDLPINYFSHCIDYSPMDKYGRRIPEHEIHFDKPDGASRDEIKGWLRLLEPDIRPKQRTLDIYSDNNSKYYNPKFFKLIKKYLPTSAFTIEPNKCVKNVIPNVENTIYDLHDFNISEKELFIHTKQTISKYC